MQYGYARPTDLSFDRAILKTKEELAKEGFGVLTEIDVKGTLKKKLGVEYDDYVILGACNPPLAHEALQAEKGIGLMLPCNVIVYREGGQVYVAAILPTQAMGMIGNERLATVARQAEEKLVRAVDAVAVPA